MDSPIFPYCILVCLQVIKRVICETQRLHHTAELSEWAPLLQLLDRHADDPFSGNVDSPFVPHVKRCLGDDGLAFDCREY